MTTFFTFLLLTLGARAESSAVVIDPQLLEAPVADKDPLVVLKRLWQAGARGTFFRLENENFDTAHYLFVENWSDVGPIDSNAAILFRDEDLRRRLVQIARIGTPILVSSSQVTGGVAFPAGKEAHALIASVVPTVNERSVIAITASTSLYGLSHELAHHWDDETGFGSELLERMSVAVRGIFEHQRQLAAEAGYKYVHEARAYRVELAALLVGNRAREWQAYHPAEGVIAVREVDGPRYRREEIDLALRIYNDHYAAGFLELPRLTRWRVGRVAKKLIPEYRRDFSRGYLRPCEMNLFADFTEGRLMGSR